MQTEHNVKWKVSLSNGETFFEGKGLFAEILGELSPWQKLLAYLTDKNVTITSLCLWTDDGRTWNLPSSGKNPNFAPFRNLELPKDFLVRRCIAQENGENGMEVTDLYTVAIGVYEQYKLEIWVDEFNTKNSWTLVNKL